MGVGAGEKCSGCWEAFWQAIERGDFKRWVRGPLPRRCVRCALSACSKQSKQRHITSLGSAVTSRRGCTRRRCRRRLCAAAGPARRAGGPGNPARARIRATHARIHRWRRNIARPRRGPVGIRPTLTNGPLSRIPFPVPSCLACMSRCFAGGTFWDPQCSPHGVCSHFHGQCELPSPVCSRVRMHARPACTCAIMQISPHPAEYSAWSFAKRISCNPFAPARRSADAAPCALRVASFSVRRAETW